MPHDAHYGKEREAIPDTTWIPLTAARGWIGFTKDKDIRHNVLERLAIAESGARIFSLTTGKITAEEMCAVFTSARRDMARVLRRYKPPFFARVSREGRVIDVMEEAELRRSPKLNRKG